jgi:hypothetical protein
MLYGVETKALNQAVKRNIERFPRDFMFQLKLEEFRQLVANCDWFASLKHSSSMPYVFTEQGIAMLSSVLKSEKAIEVNIAIMRIFVKIREMAVSHKNLAKKIKKLEEKYGKHDRKIKDIFIVLKYLVEGGRDRKK